MSIKGIFLLFFNKFSYTCPTNALYMKIVNWFLNPIAIGGSMIVSIVSGIVGMILLLSVIFNFPPYVSGKDWAFGFIDFKEGIPYNTYVSTGGIPDSIEMIETKNGNAFISYSKRDVPDLRKNITTADIVSSVKIVTNYENTAEKEDKIEISSSSLNTIRFLIRPKTFGVKLLFVLPIILTFFTISFCAWKIARLLDAIQRGMFFERDNYLRILQIGIAILILQVILITLSIFQIQYIGYVHIRFTSSIPNYRQPFQLGAAADLKINWGWIVAGCIFIILSKAFYKGHDLQEDHELSI